MMILNKALSLKLQNNHLKYFLNQIMISNQEYSTYQVRRINRTIDRNESMQINPKNTFFFFLIGRNI